MIAQERLLQQLLLQNLVCLQRYLKSAEKLLKRNKNPLAERTIEEAVITIGKLQEEISKLRYLEN